MTDCQRFGNIAKIAHLHPGGLLVANIAIGGQQPDARSAKLTGSDVAALVVRREGAQTPVEY